MMREELREQDRRQKWHTQLAIAEDLSQLTSCEYREDVLQHMEEMEVRLLEARQLIMSMLTTLFSAKQCLMLPQSISRQKLNGSCVHTSLTS